MCCGSACSVWAIKVTDMRHVLQDGAPNFDCQPCRNQARVYGSPMFDVALARYNLQAPWLTNPDSEVRSHLVAACWQNIHK